MKQTGMIRRLIAVALLVSMVLSLMPLSAQADPEGRFGVIMIYNNAADRTVKFRPQPGSSDYLDSLSEYKVVQILDETTKSGVKWLKCKTYPEGAQGYIMAEFVQEMTACEKADWAYTSASTYQTSRRSAGAAGNQNYAASYSGRTASDYIGYIRVTAASPVVFNENGTAKDASEYAGKIAAGDVLLYSGESLTGGHQEWVRFYNAANGLTGYLHNDSYTYAGVSDDRISVAGNTVEGRALGGLTTTKKAGAYTSPNAPGIASTETGNEFYMEIPAGTNMVYFQEVKNFMGYNWALVRYRGQGCYIRSDAYTVTETYVTVSDATPTPISVVTPTPTPVPGTALGYVRTVLDKVNLRETPNGKVLNEKNQIPLGTVLAYYSIATQGNVKWAQVQYNGMTGYIRSDCYSFSDAAGNLITSVTPTPTPTPVPVIDVSGGGVYGRTTTDNVMFRKVMSTSGDFWARLPKGWTVEVLGSESRNSILWYKVKGNTPANPSRTYTGYIHSSFLEIISGGETQPPSAESNYAVITLDAINLRQTPGGTPITALRVNLVVNVITKPAGNTASDWYYIETNGVYGYIPATALRVLAVAELGNFVLPKAPSVTPTPTPTPVPGTTKGYVKLVLDKVNIRKTPDGTVLTPTAQSKMPVNTILAYTAGPVKAGGYEWVEITYNGITGYVRSDCYKFCDAAGNLIAGPGSASTPTPTPIPGPTSGAGAPMGYIRLIKSGVNLRSTPWGSSLGQLNRDTVLPYYGVQYYSGSELWYQVYSSQIGAYGCILGSMAVVTDEAGASVTPTPSPTPNADPSYTGYVATLVSSVWLRTSPWANADTAGQIKQKGTVLPMVGAAVTNGVYTWYPVVTAEGVRGYLRGDCVYQLTAEQLDQYQKTGSVPTPTPPPASPRPGNSSYIQTTADKLWVRTSPSTKADTLGQLSIGTVTKFNKKQTVGNVTWYQITYNGKTGWVHGKYVRVLTNAEYDAVAPTPTPVVSPTPISDLTNLSDVAVTSIDRVKIRASASMNGRELTVVYTKGSKLSYLGNYVAPTVDNPYYWFNVKYGAISGWMRGDCVRVLTPDEKRLYELTGNADAPKEATYRTLSKGSTGEDVKALQQKLVEKGYLAADQVTGSYLTSTETAVIAFQRASGLTVDGIAGTKTQHALFGTVEQGYYDGSSTTVTLYPVEKIDWYTGGIQSIWAVGTVAIITDVYTGISFKAQRLYGDNHADCEPKTTADTAAICQIYGVSNAQEISDRESELESWRRRPLWVTIGGRTFAASMYGIPHNYAGDRIPDNNYNGQFCVHFTNSKKHTNPEVDWDAAYNGYFGAQSAIQYAYTHSISGTK